MSEGHRINRIIQISFKATPPDTKDASKKIEDLVKSAVAAKVTYEAVQKLTAVGAGMEAVATGGVNLVFGGLTGITAFADLTAGKV